MGATCFIQAVPIIALILHPVINLFNMLINCFLRFICSRFHHSHDGKNITSLVTKKNHTNITKEQRGAYLEYLNRSGYVLYARRMLLEILDELHDLPTEDILKI